MRRRVFGRGLVARGRVEEGLELREGCAPVAVLVCGCYVEFAVGVVEVVPGDWRGEGHDCCSR